MFQTISPGRAPSDMERKANHYASRQNLVFAKSPYEKVASVSNIETIERKENCLRIEPPSHKNPVNPLNYENIPKCDPSQLRIYPPSERKEIIRPAQKEDKLEIEACHKKSALKKVDNQLDILKEEWSKRDCIKLEKWFLVPTDGNNVAIIGHRPEIEEVNTIS